MNHDGSEVKEVGKKAQLYTYFALGKLILIYKVPDCTLQLDPS